MVPRRGLTQELLNHVADEEAGISLRLVMFSGLHGSVAPVGSYESVIMVASGSGIVAQLPYLKQLVYDHNNHRARTRRVHLVWYLQYDSRFESTLISINAYFTRYWARSRTLDSRSIRERYSRLCL